MYKWYALHRNKEEPCLHLHQFKLFSVSYHMLVIKGYSASLCQNCELTAGLLLCVCACVCVCAHCKASWVPAERQTHRGGALPLYIPKTSGMQALLIVFSPSLSVCVCCAVWKSQTQSFTAAARAERLWRMTERRLIPLTFTSLLHLLITRQFYSHFTWKVRPPLRYIDLQLRDGQLVVMLPLPTHKFFSHW